MTSEGIGNDADDGDRKSKNSPPRTPWFAPEWRKTPTPRWICFASSTKTTVPRFVKRSSPTPARRQRSWSSGSQRTVAANPSTPPDVLEALADDSESCVRKKVAANPSAPIELIEQFADSEDSGVRVFLATNPSTPSGLLESLAADDNKLTRRNVAAHPSTPEAVREALAADSCYVVNREAKAQAGSRK